MSIVVILSWPLVEFRRWRIRRLLNARYEAAKKQEQRRAAA